MRSKATPQLLSGGDDAVSSPRILACGLAASPDVPRGSDGRPWPRQASSELHASDGTASEDWRAGVVRTRNLHAPACTRARARTLCRPIILLLEPMSMNTGHVLA